MSNSYLTNAARIAGAGRDQGLTPEETADALMEFRLRKERRGARAMDGEDRRLANEFDMDAAGVPPELGGFRYGNGGEDIEFGVDQADWQIAQADDKDIVAKQRKRAVQAAADIGFDQRMREQGPGARERRAQAIMELRQDRVNFDNPQGRTDFRMQNGERIQEDPFIVGPRGRDGNLKNKPEQVRRIFAKFNKDAKVARGRDGNPILPQRRGLENEPQFPINFEDPDVFDMRMRDDIRRDRAAVQRMIVEDAAQFDPVIQELNDREAARQAQELGNRFNPVNDMNNIPNLRDIGNVKAKIDPRFGGFNEGINFPVAAQDGVAPAFNASGIPLGLNPPASVNSSTEPNMLNAPRDAREWLVQNQPGFKEGGRVFGDFPQVDIMGAGNDFLSRIGKIKAKGQAFDPGVNAIRNIADLQAVVDRFGDFQQAGGLKAFHLDADNKEVFVDRAGLPEIFQKMKMNQNAQGRLANAMFQLEIGRGNGVNVQRRAAFELGDDAFNARKRFTGLKGLEPAGQVQFGARLPEFGNDEAQLQKIPRGQIQVGVDAVGQPIKQEFMAALQGLQGNQAQPPLDANELRDARNGLVGLVQGEGRGRNFGFAKQLPEGAEPRAFFRAQAEERAKPGRGIDIGRVNQNANAWQRIVDREKAARNAPNQVLGVVGPAERALQAKGANFPAPPVAGIGEVKAEEWRRNPDRVQLPEKVIMSPEAIAKRKNFGRVVAQAEGGGMGGGTRPPSVVAAPSPDPWQTPPATGGGFTQSPQRRMDASMLNILAELNSGPRQGPVPGSARKQIGDRANFIAKSPRMRTARRVGYGGAGLAGLAGISSLIGGERDRREQEVQY